MQIKVELWFKFLRWQQKIISLITSSQISKETLRIVKFLIQNKMLIPKSSHTKIRKWRKQSKNTDTKTIQAQRQFFREKEWTFQLPES